MRSWRGGWHRRIADALQVGLRHDDGRAHDAVIPDRPVAVDAPPTLWGAEHADHLAAQPIDAAGSLATFPSAIAEFP